MGASRFAGMAHPRGCGWNASGTMSLGQRLWFGFSWVALGVFLAGLNRLKIDGCGTCPSRWGGACWRQIIYQSLIRSSSPGLTWRKCARRSCGLRRRLNFSIFPLLIILLRAGGLFPCSVAVSDVRAMRRLVELMRREKVMLFPEGTRSVDGRLGRGNRAVGKLIYLARPNGHSDGDPRD